MGVMRALLAFVVLGSVAGGCTCGPQPTGASRPRPTGEVAPSEDPVAAPEEPGEQPRFDEIAGGLAWHADPPLVSRRPSSSMRAAEYGVRGHDEAELTVFHFGAGQGGSIDENVQRWLDQLEQPDGRPTRDVAIVERAESNGVTITRVDARGTFAGMRGAPGAGGRHEGWRLLGAIAEGPEGVVFFKLTGPEAAIDEAEGAFRALIESIRPAH